MKETPAHDPDQANWLYPLYFAVSRSYPVPRLQLLNCFWLLLPIFLWNAVFAARLPQQGFKSDAGVPQVILMAETVFRIAVFVWPLLLPLGWQARILAELALLGRAPNW